MSICKKIKLEAIEYTRCNVASCDNVYSRTMQNKSHVVYYPFPCDKTICDQWKKFCQQSNPDYSYNFICSDHFCIDDYIFDDRGFKKLKYNAIPSVITSKGNIKAEEIEILSCGDTQENSEYDEYHVYELNECTSEQLRDQTNESVTSDRSNTEEATSVQKVNDSENEDEANDMDETAFDLLEDNSGIDDTDNPDHFDSEVITDPRLRMKALYEEARMALKLAASIKPPIPPKASVEDTFGRRVAEQLKRIADEKIYNDTVWSVQKLLQEGIKKMQKKELEYCEIEEDDVIILDSPPPNQNHEQQNDNDKCNIISLLDSSSNPETVSNRIQNDKEKPATHNTNISSDKPDSREHNLPRATVCSTPIQSQIRTPPLFTKETPIQTESPAVTVFSNSAIKSSSRIVLNSIEGSSKTANSSFLPISGKPSTFQKVILQPRELRPVTSATFTAPDVLPRLQSYPNLTPNPNPNPTPCVQNTPQRTEISAPNTAETLPPNITVPIILICPPAANQPNVPINVPVPNNNMPFSNHIVGSPPIVPSAENLPRTTPQASASNQRTATQPFVATDILRAVSNLLAASVASPKQ